MMNYELRVTSYELRITQIELCSLGAVRNHEFGRAVR